MVATSQKLHERELIPGTCGWRVVDLNDPATERIWERERFEMIEGVITNKPPVYFLAGAAQSELVTLIRKHLDTTGVEWNSACSVDFILSETLLVKPDVMFCSPRDLARQRRANAKRGNKKLKYGRILVPPTLIIESTTIGFESQDEILKKKWYAEARVPNFWILNAYAKSLKCFTLQGDAYHLDAAGKSNATLKPSAFPGLIIPLKQLWA